jgi:cytochrome c peroxidase
MVLETLFWLTIPLGLDRYMPLPTESRLTAESVQLGQELFFDARLSGNGKVSCASCHNPMRAFSDGMPIARGIDNRPGRRNSPALINRGYGRAFFWDARASSLENQVVQPIEDPNELGSSIAEAARRVGIARAEIVRALANFVRSILSGRSRFDRFMNGEQSALTDDERAGLSLFRGKANCVLCHVGPNFTDERIHNTGIAWRDDRLQDAGGGRGTFKTPTLREIARTAPYMHDGSLGTLGDVVDFYDAGGRANPSLDPLIRQLRLTSAEKLQLVAFLLSLSGEIQFGTNAEAGSSLVQLVTRRPR